jgi:hypothetical protein
MKVFNFSKGRRGQQLAEVNKANSTGGWLQRKGDKVYKITVTAPPRSATQRVDWVNGATTPIYKDGKYVGEEALTAEQFGVEAITFCTGKFRIDGKDVWQWHVLGTTEWNREACRSGTLTVTFSHTMTEADRAHGAATDWHNMSTPYQTEDERNALLARYDISSEAFESAIKETT